MGTRKTERRSAQRRADRGQSLKKNPNRKRNETRRRDARKAEIDARFVLAQNVPRVGARSDSSRHSSLLSLAERRATFFGSSRRGPYTIAQRKARSSSPRRRCEPARALVATRTGPGGAFVGHRRATGLRRGLVNRRGLERLFAVSFRRVKNKDAGGMYREDGDGAADGLPKTGAVGLPRGALLEARSGRPSFDSWVPEVRATPHATPKYPGR